MTYKSTFQDRAGQAAQAKQKALEQYKSRPPVDEKARRRTQAAGQRREEAKAEKAAAKKAEAEAKAADDAVKAAAAAPPSEAERRPPAMPVMRRGRSGQVKHRAQVSDCGATGPAR
jgi:hypothetical protein